MKQQTLYVSTTDLQFISDLTLFCNVNRFCLILRSSHLLGETFWCLFAIKYNGEAEESVRNFLSKYEYCCHYSTVEGNVKC